VDKREVSHVPPGIDPESSPFERPPTEGIPFKRGSEEDLAIRRVIEEAERAREGRDAP
jgi:hypothetical protein